MTCIVNDNYCIIVGLLITV